MPLCGEIGSPIGRYRWAGRYLHANEGLASTCCCCVGRSLMRHGCFVNVRRVFVNVGCFDWRLSSSLLFEFIYLFISCFPLVYISIFSLATE